MASTEKDGKTSSEDDVDLERIFLSSIVLPSAADAFLAKISTVDEVAKSGDVVLDTNALLIPYGAGAESLQQIVQIFCRLKSEGRIYLPAQVAREFIKNRPNKISELHKGLSDRGSRFTAVDRVSYPILEGIAEYGKLNELLEKTQELKKEITKTNSDLLSKIHSWEWTDPVNASYKKVFSEDRIVEPEINQQELAKELLRRIRLSIPPGYKDAKKDDLGVGDLMIWKTILHIGGKNKKDLIFVSGDEKADWQHRANGVGFLPRYELLDEFRRVSSGKAFYIVQLSKLLELLSAESTSVAEIKQEEERVQEANSASVICPFCENIVISRLGEYPGSSAHPVCPSCERKFHIHRTNQGVTIHKPNEKASLLATETVQCPSCNQAVIDKLHAKTGSTASFRCLACRTNFPVHRMLDGGVKVSRYAAESDEGE